MKVDDETGQIKASVWTDFKIKQGDIVKLFGYITKEKEIAATHINIVTLYDEFTAHKLLVTKNKIKMELAMYTKDCFNIDVKCVGCLNWF